MTEPLILYTPEKANAALPLVSRIVEDITVTYVDLEKEIGGDDLHVRNMRVNMRGRAQPNESSESQKHLENYIEELRGLGIDVQDPKNGLILFHSDRNGEPVYLCWALGDEAVTHWYSLHESYAARRPIDFGEVAKVK